MRFNCSSSMTPFGPSTGVFTLYGTDSSSSRLCCVLLENHLSILP
jgi:hypothetical protein